MGYVLAFFAGTMFGIVTMCIFIVSGNESRIEENTNDKTIYWLNTLDKHYILWYNTNINEFVRGVPETLYHKVLAY